MRIAARALLFVTAAAGATAVWAQQQDMSEVEITTVEIAPGVAVLFGNGGNIGVSHGEDGTVLIDDQFAELSEKIQQAVSDLGALPTRFLINTHYHFDHAGGNENFGNAGATIVAHDNVRTRLEDGSNVLGNVTPPAPKAALPVVTYDKGMTFHLNGDVIDVMFLGGGHTDGDSVIRWQKANVMHMGDMFMHNAGWPFIDVDSGGNVEHLLNSLSQAISMMDAETVVIPGHGELATRSDLMAFRTMVQTGVNRVKALKDQGSTLEEALAARPVDGLRNVANGFIADDQFVQAVWASLEAHGH
jgi:glyoxylase-like metal-dependent hydrolase (beta-lactamase superfamily II)